MRRDLMVAIGVLLVILSILCWSATGYWALRAERFRRLGRRETFGVTGHGARPEGGRSRGPSAVLRVEAGGRISSVQSVDVDEAELARYPVWSSVELVVLPGEPPDVMLAERLDALSLGSYVVVSVLCSLLCLLWLVGIRRRGYSLRGLAAEAVEGASKGRPSAEAE